VGITVTAASKENSVSPTVIRLGRSGLKWWEVDPDGDGAICARLSSEDENKGETVMGQIIGGRELASRKDLKPRYVLVAEKQSGKSSIQTTWISSSMPLCGEANLPNNPEVGVSEMNLGHGLFDEEFNLQPAKDRAGLHHLDRRSKTSHAAASRTD